MAPHSAALHLLEILLELFDSSMCTFKILIESITLADELRFPLAETMLLNLNLLRKSLPQAFFFLLRILERVPKWLRRV